MTELPVDESPRKNKKVCFIGGAGHSGSTLVGMVLGSHPDCFYAGEAAKTRYLHNPKKDERKRVCKLCGRSCPIWADFQVRTDVDLYEQLSARTGRPLVVESTKNLEWIRSRLADLEGTGALPHFIFLKRDGRAVINSRVRKYPQKDPAMMIDRWVRRMEETEELYTELELPKLELRYEEFATAPEPATRELCRFLGLDYRPSMLEFYRHEHHPLGGNNGTQYLVARHQGPNSDRPYATLAQRSRTYYEKHAAGIKLDLRWQRELDDQVLALFERMAGATNAALRWDA